MAASAAVLGGIARLPLSPRSPSPSSSSSATLLLPPRPSRVHLLNRSSFALGLQESPRFSSLRIRASSSEDSGSVQVDELFSDLKEKWDGLENKSTVIIYGGGAVVAIWLSSIIVGAINSVPLLPKLMELVGLGYTGWFVYRYLLFKSSRKELVSDIEELKRKIAGTGE